MSEQKPTASVWSRYGYLWATSALFLVSLAGHWIFGWYAFAQDQLQHGQVPTAGQFVVQAMRDTFENWQSEFLQLIWQVSGLALLYHIGSPSSKEGHDRLEEKVDLILKKVDDHAEEKIARLDRLYQRD